MGHSIHNFDINKPLTHTTPYMPSALYDQNWDSSVKRTPHVVPNAIECEHLPTQVSYDEELQSGRDPDEDNEHADELPWDGFRQFVQKFFGYANRLLQQLSGWLSQTILQVKMLWLQSDQQVVCVSCLFSMFVVEITWVRFDSLPCARCLHGSPCHRYLNNYFSCLIHLFSLYLSPPRVQSCVWPLWCEHATLRSLPTFASLFPSSCPGVPGVVFCGFSNSAHLCMLNRELPYSDVASALMLGLCAVLSPLWCCVSTDAGTLFAVLSTP